MSPAQERGNAVNVWNTIEAPTRYQDVFSHRVPNEHIIGRSVTLFL